MIFLFFSFIGCGEDIPPDPPREISTFLLDPSSLEIQENSIITIGFSEIPRNFSYNVEFDTPDISNRCWNDGSECFDLYLDPEWLKGKMTATWEENRVQLAFTADEPVWPGHLTIYLSYSAYDEYVNSKWSLTPDQQSATTVDSYRFRLDIPKANIVSTSIDPLIDVDGVAYVREREPFKLIWTFDKPPPGIQLLKGDFSWCWPIDSYFGDLVCPKMDSDPVYYSERQGNVFIATFPEGISAPRWDEKGIDRFGFSIVWAGPTRDSRESGWWRNKAQIRLQYK